MDTTNQNGGSDTGLSSTPTVSDTPTTPVASDAKPVESDTSSSMPNTPEVPADAPVASSSADSTASVSPASVPESPAAPSSADATISPSATVDPVLTQPEQSTPVVAQEAQSSPASAPTETSTMPESPVTPTPVEPVVAPEPVPAENGEDSMSATIAVAPPPVNTSETSGAATAGAVAVSSGGSKKGMIMALITVILLAGLAVGAYFMFMQSTPAVSVPSSAKKVSNAAPISPTLPPVDEQAVKAKKDTSDTQLDKDTSVVDASMKSLDNAASSADAGLADKPVSLN